jgi:DNA-binding response OmpR family regulator
MAVQLDFSARINLRATGVLVLDANPQALDVLRQILSGFGARSIHGCANGDETREAFSQRTLQLVIVDPLMTEEDGFELIRWMRRQEMSPNHTLPIIATIGHNTRRNVMAARDAGANFVVAKPLSPETLLQRIEWIARENRQFIVAPGYVGPDRRFKNEGPPPGCEGRRADDLPIEVPLEAASPNMNQSEIDGLFKPRKVVL